MKITIKTTCPKCGLNNHVSVNEKDYEDYLNGKLCQKAFPYLSPAQRELIITGICKTCWRNFWRSYK